MASERSAAEQRAYMQGRLDQFWRMKKERPSYPTFWDLHEERDLKDALSLPEATGRSFSQIPPGQSIEMQDRFESVNRDLASLVMERYKLRQLAMKLREYVDRMVSSGETRRDEEDHAWRRRLLKESVYLLNDSATLSLPEATEPPRWISVEERLPDPPESQPK